MSILNNFMVPVERPNVTGIVTKFFGKNRYSVKLSEQKTIICRSFIPGLEVNSRVTINNTDAGYMIVGSGLTQSATTNIIWIDG